MPVETAYPSYSIVGNNFGFLGRPLREDPGSADVAVIGVPYDLGTSGRGGARHGPQAIRAASANLKWEEQRWPWPFNALERLEVIDCGDLSFPPGESAAMVERLERTVSAHLSSGRKVLAFGGDHFITLPLLRAHARHLGEPVRVVHFDAHTDSEETDESRYYHGSMFYHAPKEGIVDARNSVQIGIRTEYRRETHPFEVIDADAVADLGVDGIVATIKDTVGDGPVYITFDIDCLDPAFAPGTGTPVVGGISTAQALRILRGLVGLRLVGMDIVEVAPAYDSSEITALAAATLGLEFLYVLAACTEPAEAR
jgi:agmatinase